MKKATLPLLILTGTMLAGMAQEPSLVSQSTDPAVLPHPLTSSMDYVPGEILVKFRNEVNVPTGTNLKSSGISSVDQILKANEYVSLEKLFPAEKRMNNPEAGPRGIK